MVITVSLPQKFIPSKEFLHQKYVTEGFSSREIAAQIDSSRQMVTTYLKRHQIPLKTITRRQTGRHTFGFRQYGGKAVELRKEQEITKLIESYRKNDLSFTQIAKIFNEKDIRTKKSRGPWYPKIIKQIFLRKPRPNIQLSQASGTTS